MLGVQNRSGWVMEGSTAVLQKWCAWVCTVVVQHSADNGLPASATFHTFTCPSLLALTTALCAERKATLKMLVACAEASVVLLAVSSLHSRSSPSALLHFHSNRRREIDWMTSTHGFPTCFHYPEHSRCCGCCCWAWSLWCGSRKHTALTMSEWPRSTWNGSGLLLSCIFLARSLI